MLTVDEEYTISAKHSLSEIINRKIYSIKNGFMTFETLITEEHLTLLNSFFPKVLVVEIVSYLKTKLWIEYNLSPNHIRVDYVESIKDIISFRISYECEYGCWHNLIKCNHPIPQINIDDIGRFDVKLVKQCLQELCESKKNTNPVSEHARRWNLGSKKFSGTVHNLLNKLRKYDSELLMNTFEIVLWFHNIADSYIEKSEK